MSLQVWLPLNGNLNNYGLNNLTITNNTATVDNSGKIGQCYNFNGSQCINTNFTQQFGTGDFSLCAWIYLVQTSGKTYQQILGTKTTGAASVGCAIYWNQNQKKFLWSTGDGSSATEIWTTDTFDNIIYNSWHHIIMVRNNSDPSKGYFYIDGQRKAIASIPAIRNISSITSPFCIGQCYNSTNAAYYFTGKINDIRIYNHALSAKEAEEISKGLVLHYKLDDTYIESSSFLSSSISTTAYNASLGKYGYNADSNLGKVDGFFQGRQCTKVYTLTANQTAQPYSYFSNLFTSDGTNAPAYKTLSFDYYTTVPTTTWLNIYKLGNGTGTATWKVFNSAGIKTGTYTNSSNSIAIIPNEWNHVEVTLHGTTSANAEWGYCINGPAHTSSTDYYFLYANIQLEEKDHATGYGSNMHSNIIYDSSGYQHNGENINNISIESNSPRYNSCIHMSATNQKIKISNFSTAGFGNSYTFAWWEKISSATPMHWGFADGIRLNGMYTGRLWNTGDGSNNPLYTPGTTTQVATPSTGVWHHWVMTGDGITCKVYQDGVLWGQAKTYKAISGSTIYINGWDSGTSYCSDNASMCDFRIYCTALTAEQVQELYNTSATIDNNGNVYAREVIE